MVEQSTGGHAPEIVTVQPVTTAVVRDTVPMEGLPDFFDSSFSILRRVVRGQGVRVTGPAFGLYHGAPGDSVDLEVGIGTERPIDAEGDAEPGSLPGGRVARLVHAGSYDTLSDSWARLGLWIGEEGQSAQDTMWEVYLNEPSPETDPAELRTELNWLLLD